MSEKTFKMIKKYGRRSPTKRRPQASPNPCAVRKRLSAFLISVVYICVICVYVFICVICGHDSIHSNTMPTPTVASSSSSPRSIRTTLPLLIRAKLPFLLASAIVRGKFSSTTCPARRGVVAGTLTSTPPLLMLLLLPLKNLFASGSHTLTGHATSVLVVFLCSLVAVASLII
jgi:hypothetical protein